MGCCCNKKNKLKSCGCVEQETSSGGTFNLIQPGDTNGDNEQFYLTMDQYGGQPERFNISDAGFWLDRIGCQGDVSMTVTTSDPLVEGFGFAGPPSPGSNVLTLVSTKSQLVYDLSVYFFVPPPLPYDVTGTITYIGCGYTIVQPGIFHCVV